MAPSSVGRSSADRIRLVWPPGVAALRSGPSRRTRLVGLPAVADLAGIVDLFCRLRLRECWPEMRTLLDDGARLESIAAQGVAGPDHTIEAMRFAVAGEMFAVDEYELELLGPDEAVFVRARVRYPRSAERVCAANWLVTGRDELIWRARIVASSDEAELILEREGSGLGL